MRATRTCLLSFCVLLTGCTAMPENAPSLTPPDSQYDARLFSPDDGSVLTVPELARRLAGTDVIVVGEYHGHHGAHLLQARLQQALYRQNPDQLLTMEQFNVDHQQDLDRYLSGDTGEAEMIEDAAAWDNYRASYRPLVEFARQRNLPVIAANAPADVVRCVGRKGPAYLESLPGEVRRQLPESPFMEPPGYREKFVEAIGGSHGTDGPEMSECMRNTYQAQLLRDNTMASAILGAHEQYPGRQILHTTGTFHSEQRLGTVAVLEQRAPALSIAVISPVTWPEDRTEAPLAEHTDAGDYLYFVQPLPEEFRDRERQRKAMAARFRNSPETDCD